MRSAACCCAAVCKLCVGLAVAQPCLRLRLHTLAHALQAEEVQLVDVREQFEFDTARLPGFQLLPMSQANEWAPTIEDRLQQDKETVVSLACRLGCPCCCMLAVTSPQLAVYDSPHVC